MEIEYVSREKLAKKGEKIMITRVERRVERQEKRRQEEKEERIKRTKKRRFWLPILLLTVAIAGGSFAYTYLTATQQITVAGTGEDIATVTDEGSPSWGALSGQQAGPLPETSLFRITVDSNYTGNLLVFVSLENAGDLRGVYQHLNMRVKIFVEDTSTIAGRNQGELMTLDNAKASFGLSHGTGWADYYLVKITGGSFNTLQGATAGFSPIFHCEVSQR